MIDYGRYKCLTVKKDERVALVTFSRPESLNAFNTELFYEFNGVLDDLGKDDEVHVVVVTGAGKAFSAGADLRELQDPEKFLHTSITMDNWRKLAYKMVDFDKPLIAALNGDAVGGGASITFLFDIVYAAENARIGEIHVRRGLVPPCGPAMLPLLIGPVKAKLLLMGGKLIKAREAERLGLVNEVFEDDKVVAAALETAHLLARGPTRAIRWTKFCINKHVRAAMNLVFDTSTALEWLASSGEDCRESVSAFLEKREPRFTGK